MKTGLIIEPPKPEDYVLGGKISLKGEVLQPDADWAGFLPDNEIQNKNNVETFSCVSFATNNCIEILEKKIYGARNNWSDRFLAFMSGTKEKQGNTPNNVAETRRKKGNVKEEEWPFDETITSYDKYYAPIPENIKTMAIGEGAEYSFGYEFVPSNAKAIMEALKYSPVAASVYAWVKDENGKYYRPQGMTDNHLTVFYGYVKGEYFKAFDSYFENAQVLKKVRWDSIPMTAMRYTLNRQIVIESFWQKFLKQLMALLGL